MKTVAVTGGKGGVGKTNIAVNMAILAAKRGLRTVLMDADFGLANVDVMMGITPTKTLEDVLSGKCPWRDALHEHPSGVQVLAGASGVAELIEANLSRLETAGLELAALAAETDLLVIDTAAGIGEGVISMLCAADDVLLVMTPDPSSVVDTYAVVKTLVSRQPEIPMHALVNMADDERSARLLHAKLYAVVRDYLAAQVRYSGSLLRSASIQKAVLSRKAFVDLDPTSAKQLAYATEWALGKTVRKELGTSFFSRLLGSATLLKRKAA